MIAKTLMNPRENCSPFLQFLCRLLPLSCACTARSPRTAAQRQIRWDVPKRLGLYKWPFWKSELWRKQRIFSSCVKPCMCSMKLPEWRISFMMLGGQLSAFNKEYIFKVCTSLKSIKPHTKVRNLRLLARVESKYVSLFTVIIEKDFKYPDIANPLWKHCRILYVFPLQFWWCLCNDILNVILYMYKFLQWCLQNQSGFHFRDYLV